MRTAALLAILLLAGCQGGDAPIPVGYETKVEDARTSLEGNWAGLPRPIFAYVRVRCRMDGGLLIVFIERGGRHDGTFSVAMQGPGAVDGSYAWAGGFGIPDVDADPETAFFFSESPEAACPPAPR